MYMCNVRAHVHVLQRFLAKELLSISISPSSLTSQLTLFPRMCTIVHMGARPAASGLYIGPGLCSLVF